MRFSLVASVLGSALLTAAAPVAAPGELATRAVCSLAPWAIWRVDQSHPDQSGLYGFEVFQTSPTSGREDVLLEFYPPANSNTCQLKLVLPAGYDVTTNPNPVQVEFYSTNGHLPSGGVSWNNAPDFVSQVGAYSFSSHPTNPTNVYINSFVCDTKMTYRLRIAKWVTSAASVKFNNFQGTEFQMSYCTNN